ncbi:hypothetical protein LOTGIDRAFT_231339 [Lottia gigantea]|uniref:Lysozyme n=1 Tax=Lottia gigantea TaxID=225164 RepID=V4ATI8_LOTGI|nr:hypothetical protein LOTGIDRAFT_231339 [Lottia gigantea]ESO98225.1 hypothetical protein LOTGIDRAFT_231339 [Lottia gigantea]
MSKMGYMAYILVVFALLCFYVNADQCTYRGGQCKRSSGGWWFWSRRPSCYNGRFVNGLCSSNYKCCVPNTPKPTKTTPPPVSYQCYGDFMKLNPTGAGKLTSGQDWLKYTGVRASNKMLDTDLAELNKRKQCYIRAGRNSCIHPAIIAAIASRESRGGRLLYASNGLGDKKKAWGIMQCDLHKSGQDCKKYKWDSCDHINHMTQTVLLPFVKTIKRNHPSWAAKYQLKGGVAAYNFGPGNVQTIPGMDDKTTGDDYSNDVIARAQRLVKAYGW